MAGGVKRPTYSSRIGHARVPSRTIWNSQAGFIGLAQEASRQITTALRDIIEEFKGPLTIDAMFDALEPTLEIAKGLTPVLTGKLRDSGYLEVTQFRGTPQVQIGFAKGGNPYYAEYVHEMTGIKHAPPTQAKFLQAAVLGDLNGIRSRLGSRYGRAFHG